MRPCAAPSQPEHSMLDPSFALPSGLFHFRIVVGVALHEPAILEADEHEGEEEMVGYYRTYGVTAASASAAVALLEKEYAQRDDDDTGGIIAEFDVAILDVTAEELPASIEEIDEAGIHFESGMAFFPAEEFDEEVD
jgi:hypothetical protein